LKTACDIAYFVKLYQLAFDVGDGALVGGFAEQKYISHLYNCTWNKYTTEKGVNNNNY